MASRTDFNCVLLRYGEIGIKSKKTRQHFERLYIEAIETALERQGISDFRLQNMGGRFILYTPAVADALPVLQRLPGIQSLSPGLHFPFSTREEILDQVAAAGLPYVAGKRFCVRVKRVGQHPFDSLELAREAGGRLYDASAGVDLIQPEVTISLEVRRQEAYIYVQKLEGMGGLPPKSSGRVLVLFSGGIDSPVAAWQMLKRGCSVDFLLINLMGDKSFYQAAQVYNFLIHTYAYGYKPRLFVADGRPLVEFIQAKVSDRLRQIALKIAFYQLGEALARRKGYPAIVTGESLSQKSSQTLESLTLIESQCGLPVLRPLLCADKKDTTWLAGRIGTLAASEQVKEYCNLAEGKVATAPQPRDLEQIPSFQPLIADLMESLRLYKGICQIEENIAPEPIGSDIVTVDIRPASLQTRSPLPVDLSLPYPAVLEELEAESGKSYLLICDFGVRSEDVAHALRKKGIPAAGMTVPHFLKYFLPVKGVD